MNWFKRSQIFPSDEEMAYYTGEDFPDDEEYVDPFDEKEERRRRQRYYDKQKKIYLNQDAIEALTQQLSDPSLTEEQRKKIRLQIGKHRGAISRIRNSVN